VNGYDIIIISFPASPELKAYYDRKVLNGKSKMSIINAVRFKLLARVVSVVKSDREYVKKTA